MNENQARGLIERRTVVRAGVWAVPAVAVVTAVPAYAACSGGGLSGTMIANYANHTNAATVDPTRIQVTSTVTNTGTTATTGYTRILSIPAGLFDTVSAPSVNGYNGPTRSGSEATGLTLTYVRQSQLSAGASETFATTLTLGGTSASPFRGWQGPAFALTAQVNGGGTCGTLPTPASVAATPNTTLSISNWAADRSNGNLTVGDDSGSTTTRVLNTGRKAVGPVTLAVTVPKGTGRYSSAEPTPSNISTGWAFVAPRTENSTSWTYTFRTTNHLAPDGLNEAAQTHMSPSFEARIILTGPSNNTPNQVMISAVASASGATNSSSVSNDD
jgi:hypothetical protein